MGGDGKDVTGVDDAIGSRLERAEQLLLLVRCKQVFLVQHNDDRAPAPEQHLQRFEFRLGDIAVDHEDHQVGAPCHLFRHRFPFFSASLVEAGRIDQVDATCLDLFPRLYR